MRIPYRVVTVWPVSDRPMSGAQIAVDALRAAGDRPTDDGRRAPGTPLIPGWLARLGWSGWMVAGLVIGLGAALVAIAVLLPVLTPVIFAVLLGAVLQPLVGWLRQHRVGPGLAASIGALAVPVVVVALVVVVLYALRGQGTLWQQTAQSAAARLRSGIGTDPVTPLLDASR